MKYLHKITALLTLAVVCFAPACKDDKLDSGVPERLFRPVNIQVAAKETTVTASWAGIAGASSYCAELWRRAVITDGEGIKFEDKVLVARNENVSSTSWAVTGLDYDTQYYFRLKANNVDLDMNSHYTEFVSVKTPAETQVLRAEVMDPLKGIVSFTWMQGLDLTYILLRGDDGSEQTYDINDADGELIVRGLSAGNYTAVAGNADRSFNVLNILIPVLYEVDNGDITFDGVTLHWAPDGNIVKISLSNLKTMETKEFNIDGNAGEKFLSAEELGYFQSYRAILVYADDAVTNAVKFTTKDKKPEGIILVSTYAELKQALLDVADGGSIGLNPGLYEVKENDDTGTLAYASLDITKSVTIMAATAEMPQVIFKQFSLKNTAELSLVRIDGLEVAGYDEFDNGSSASYFMDLTSGSATVNTLEIENCYIHGIANSIIRADRSATATVLNVLINNNIMINMNGKQSYVSTYNSDKGVVPSSITFTNNTVTGLSSKNANQRAFGYLASAGHVFTMSNNTFYNCQSGTANFAMARGSSDGSYGKVEVKGNIFYNKPVDATKSPNKAPTFGTNPAMSIENNVLTFPWGTYNSTSGVLTTDDWSQYATSKADPKFTDPSHNDFHITNSDVTKLNAGDPRWFVTE